MGNMKEKITNIIITPVVIQFHKKPSKKRNQFLNFIKCLANQNCFDIHKSILTHAIFVSKSYLISKCDKVFSTLQHDVCFKYKLKPYINYI